MSHEAVKVVQRGRLAALRRWWDTVGRVESDRGLYLALAELTRRANQPDGAAPSPLTPLTRWELRVFSQNGEDGVLAEIFRRIGSGGRYFVEFGIESGREGNSVYLADVDGWSGLFIEADPQMFDELQGKYRATDRVRTARSLVTPDNIERLLTEAGVPEEPDLLSIDIDGQDYWIWEAICAFRPRVVVIEYNSRLDPARRLVQPLDPGRGWDGTAYTGASLQAMRSLGARKGYRLVHTELAGLNAFFVRSELAAAGGFPDDDVVPLRARPNYFLGGFQHPRDPANRSFHDLGAD